MVVTENERGKDIMGNLRKIYMVRLKTKGILFTAPVWRLTRGWITHIKTKDMKVKGNIYTNKRMNDIYEELRTSITTPGEKIKTSTKRFKDGTAYGDERLNNRRSWLTEVKEQQNTHTHIFRLEMKT